MLNEKVPPGLTKYRETGIFTAETLPTALQKTHQTKANVWVRANVLDGSIFYVPEDGTGDQILMRAGEWMLIHPQAPHHVRLCGPVRISLEFFRNG